MNVTKKTEIASRAVWGRSGGDLVERVEIGDRGDRPRSIMTAMVGSAPPNHARKIANSTNSLDVADADLAGSIL
jgi:hypothetical protein